MGDGVPGIFWAKFRVPPRLKAEQMNRERNQNLSARHCASNNSKTSCAIFRTHTRSANDGIRTHDRHFGNVWNQVSGLRTCPNVQCLTKRSQVLISGTVQFEYGTGNSKHSLNIRTPWPQ
jgi:hypothetical protein